MRKKYQILFDTLGDAKDYLRIRGFRESQTPDEFIHPALPNQFRIFELNGSGKWRIVGWSRDFKPPAEVMLTEKQLMDRSGKTGKLTPRA